MEQKLAGSLGIGQPTLREALKELEFQGSVRKIPKRGIYVTKLVPEDFRKILEVRMVLEALAVETAAPNLTKDAVGELEGRQILDGLRSRDPWVAREAFISNTLHF